MLRIRRLALVSAVGIAALCAFGATQSFAAAPLPPCPFVYPGPPANPAESVQSAHFIVYYTDDPAVTSSITQTQAGAILAAAERAYATYTGDGFPAPAVDGTGKTEFDVTDLASWNISSEYCLGAVDLHYTAVTGSDMAYVIGFDVFTQVEFSIGGGAEDWLMNGAAAWASWRALGYPASSITDIGPFSISLDCNSTFNNQILANCSKNGYENLGDSRWPFYEYLTETYGPLFMTNVFTAAGLAGGDGDTGLQNALAAKGSSLAGAYAAYTAKLLAFFWVDGDGARHRDDPGGRDENPGRHLLGEHSDGDLRHQPSRYHICPDRSRRRRREPSVLRGDADAPRSDPGRRDVATDVLLDRRRRLRSR